MTARTFSSRPVLGVRSPDTLPAGGPKRASPRQAFTGEAVRSYAGLIDGVVQRYFARWDAGGEFRAYQECKDLAFDVAACALLGMQLDVRAPAARRRARMCHGRYCPGM